MHEVETIPTRRRQCPIPDRGGSLAIELGVQLRKNPYSPGAGLRPPALVGRDRELKNWSIALRQLQGGCPAPSFVLHGLGGEGRTVLLGEFHRMAEERDLMTVIIEAGGGSSLRDTLARALYPVVRELVRPEAGDKLEKALATFKAFSVKVDIAGAWSFGYDVTSERGRGDSGELETDLSELIRDLAEAAQEQSRGLVILIDEAHDLTRKELSAICEICHQGKALGWPMLIALAGLPSLPKLLSKATSWSADLFSHGEISRLDADAAREALIRPAFRENVSWDEDAVRYLITETEGHPYFLQQCAQATWDVAMGPTLTFADARVGVVSGRAHLDAGFYRTHWERATLAQKAYLKAMARDGDGPSQSADVADRLGKTPMSVGSFRDTLIKKSLVFVPRHGQVAYAIPGMADFITRQSRT